ncbi:MAG TPA: hypothetical protein DIW36_07955 [Ruminococcaceae bacterium]|nr:hypothetical protein [Oscillospiraceae bacterium]HCT17293.1 hypothetical protein [Oscillospiraceae bacterium]
MGREKASDKNHRIFYIVLTVIALAAMLARCFFSVITTDEVFNLGEAYRTVLGQKFMVENWDFFQVGDSLNYPFIWLFYKITGSSEGIVIYSRICSVFITFIFALLTYKLLKPIFGKTNSFATCLIYFTVVPKTIFGYWYDTWSLSFMLLSFALIIFAMNKDKPLPWLILAGVCQAISVYAYPTAVFVFIYEFIVLFIVMNKDKKKIGFKKPELAYALGAAAVFAVFVIFCLTRDWQNFFIFNKDITSSGLSNRTAARSNELLFVRHIISDFFHYYRSILICSVGFAVLCIAVKRLRLSNIWIAVYTALASAFIYIYIFRKSIEVFPGSKSQNLLNVFLFFSICGFILYITFFLKEKRFKNMFLFLYIPSMLAGLVWAFTGLDKSINIPLGSRSASILFLAEFFELMSQVKFKKPKIKNFAVLAMCFMLVFNILSIYCQGFFSTVPAVALKNSLAISSAESGVFKYIYDKEETVYSLECFEKKLKTFIKDDDKTVLFGRGMMYGYLMTDLKPNTNYLWRSGALTGKSTDPEYYDILFKYFDSYYGSPDLIVLKKDEFELTNKKFVDFLNQNYDLAEEDSGVVFYRLKQH